MSSYSDSELRMKRRMKAKDKIVRKDFLQALKNFKTSREEEQLLLSVKVNNSDLLQRLLEDGTSANTRDNIGRCALHLAASRGYKDIVRILLCHGADPNVQDMILNTPLHLAACNSNLEVVTLLIDGGADIRMLDINGRNPLQIAESKLHILMKGWQSGAVETKKIHMQVQEIIEVMLSLWRNKTRTNWGHHRDNVDDLEFMKLSLRSNPEPEIDDQMSKLLSELKEFSIK
ncbi:PREDICTED: ankyrin repeat domain-containing protein 54 [Nicrophorus vespilloides]|uniref:Ankyrin repeat domain-containing protein 54 n=1 Tax=Nicrophorus vespilloides TaxID=110193 RepID=A0ABM1MMZ9_NICVS|nr:PREDICTED: ankyrin repeat domain-containing protein 54 [Nicrophorus vespilloides]